jgi:hypothetical protein
MEKILKEQKKELISVLRVKNLQFTIENRMQFL